MRCGLRIRRAAQPADRSCSSGWLRFNWAALELEGSKITDSASLKVGSLFRLDVNPFGKFAQALDCMATLYTFQSCQPILNGTDHTE